MHATSGHGVGKRKRFASFSRSSEVGKIHKLSFRNFKIFLLKTPRTSRRAMSRDVHHGLGGSDDGSKADNLTDWRISSHFGFHEVLKVAEAPGMCFENLQSSLKISGRFRILIEVSESLRSALET